MDVQLSYADWLQIQRNQPAALNAVFADGSAVAFSIASHETRCESDCSESKSSDAFETNNSEIKSPEAKESAFD